MLFNTLIETYIKFPTYCAVSALSFGAYKGSKMAHSLLSCNLIPGWGDEAVLCETGKVVQVL